MGSMKRYTSRLLRFIAFLHLAFPVAYLVPAALLFDIPAVRVAAILISPVFYAVSMLAMAAGYVLLEVRSWAWHLFVLSSLVNTYYTAFILVNEGTIPHKFLAFVVAAVLVCAFAYQVTRELRVPYFSPRIRWWETNPKFRLYLPVLVLADMGRPSEGRVMDLSGRGCFIKLREAVPRDSKVRLKFSLLSQTFDVTGTVVWNAESGVTHPRGVGVKFDSVERENRKRLRALSRRLRKLAVAARLGTMSDEDLKIYEDDEA